MKTIYIIAFAIAVLGILGGLFSYNATGLIIAGPAIAIALVLASAWRDGETKSRIAAKGLLTVSIAGVASLLFLVRGPITELLLGVFLTVWLICVVILMVTNAPRKKSGT
jgi:hypothetical protein